MTSKVSYLSRSIPSLKHCVLGPRVPQLLADDVSLCHGPVIITHSPPLTVVVYLHPTLSLILTSHQPDGVGVGWDIWKEGKGGEGRGGSGLEAR